MSAYENRSNTSPMIALARSVGASGRARRAGAAVTLTVAGLVAMGSLKAGMGLADGLLPGVAGVCIEVVAAGMGLCVGAAMTLLSALPMARYGPSVAGAGAGDAPPTASSRRRRTRSLLQAVAVLVLEAAALWTLSALLPFRGGLVSCLYYYLPAVLLVCLLALRSVATLCAVGALTAVAASLVVPVRDLQAHLAAQQWLRGSGVSTRAQAQIVVLPGMPQEPYAVYQGAVIANFDTYVDGSAMWTAVETVAVGKSDPCGPMLVADGDADGTDSMSCRQVAPGLWLRRNPEGDFGYVLQRDGVTTTVTGGSVHTTVASLRREILAAHPASDAELWSREGPTSASPLGLILL